MEIKDLELEAIKMDSFKAGYVAALQAIAAKMEAEKVKANEPATESK